MAELEAYAADQGLQVHLYRGDGAAMLAFDYPEASADRLAGFAVKRVAPDGSEEWLVNRLSFAAPITALTTPAQRVWTPTNQAPLQRFHWMDFPGVVVDGTYRYETTAMLFVARDGTKLETGPTVGVEIELKQWPFPGVEVAFTRGYLSSQAYYDTFGNADIRPMPKTLDYDTAPYQAQYSWLGFHAGKLIFETIAEVQSNANKRLDVFAYDLDEPDIVRGLISVGDRLRLFADDSATHQAGSLEAEARQRITAAGGVVKTGHFSRFAHSKVLIVRDGDTPVKVLTGSANFSVRGLYVQANNVLMFTDAGVAKLYGQVFDAVWADPHSFSSSDLAAGWIPAAGAGLPPIEFAFSPHHQSSISLDELAHAIAGAKSSLLFAIMELHGSGEALGGITSLRPDSPLYYSGVTQRVDDSLRVQTASDPLGTTVPFGYLHGKVPPPFHAETSGGAGQVIHDKMVIIDFNDASPVVFTGSSNLAAGGERENGDNLLEIRDPTVAATYAVEALRLIDHYRFRAAMQSATVAEPLRLRRQDERWWQRFYDPAGMQSRERALLARPQAATPK